MGAQNGHFFEFGPFRLDAEERVLWRDGQPVPLTAKAFDTLLVLVRRRGHIVGKEELLREVWPDSFVEEGNLSFNVSLLRKALGEDAHRPQFIETVARRGYRFIAEVRAVDGHEVSELTVETRTRSGLVVEEEAGEESSTAGGRARAAEAVMARPAAAAAVAQSGRQVARRFKSKTALAQALLVPAAAVIVAVAVVAYQFYPAHSGDAIDSIAVLPFANVGNDENTEYLSDGVSDSIIDSLSELPNLKKVIPFSSVLRYKGRQIDPQAVGRELNVGAVLTGRLTLRGDEVLVSTELVDVKDNRRLWGGQYSHRLADVFKLQGEIAQDISEKLRLKLTGEQKERLTRPDTENAEAYQLYLQGRYFLSKNTDEATIKSGEYFEKAIEKDPDFALAYVASARRYGIMANFGNMRPNEAWPKAEAAVVKALAIDNRLAEAHEFLGLVKMFYDWDWPGAEREFKRALELKPELVRSGSYYYRLLEVMGKFDEAIAERKKADEIDPVFRGGGLASILYRARRYDRAIEEYRKELERGPNRRGVVRMNLGVVYAQQGRYEEALAAAHEARAIVTQPRHLAQIGYVYAAAGKRDEAIKILEEVKALTGERYNLGTHIAAIYAALGNKDEALAWLKRACDEHEQGVIDLKIDPRFDTLRSDPRFTDLLRRVKLAP
jgi:TolB-like protein/DNA-binding winged helix-turn-helix (wHTH) protein/Tfp pilus assembly protein PilF